MRKGALATIMVVPLILALAAIAASAPPAAQAAAPGLRATALQLAPDNALVDLAGDTVVEIRVDGVSALYGYQFAVTYDQSKVSAVGAFSNAFFDTTQDAEIVWNATCAAGECRFAVSKLRPADPVSGSGVLAQITFSGLAAGISPLRIEGSILAERDGVPIAHTAGDGIITVCTGTPLLELSPATSKIAIGESTTVTVTGLCLTGLYGYQFEVLYDAATLSAAGAFVNDFFDTQAVGAVPPGWDAACSAGVCRFGATRINPAQPLAGTGVLATIDFTGLHAGIVPLSFNADILADRDGMPIAHDTSEAVITVYGFATLYGTVTLQGRFSGPVDAGTVTFTETTSIYPAVTVPFDGATGAYTAQVPVDPGGMTYLVLAQHSLYLSNLHSGVNVLPEQTYPLATTKLLAGDANNDGWVHIQDLSCIGGDYLIAPDVCGATGWTDINADGVVNILDLSLAGGNYNRKSPQPW